ncbi:hypothetical protein [Succinivibrio dextrinosolvens]|uniref:hypothetical protein n=1 Tax=Succinivibrio dextrinosolvens TaxID=83771 RepID=UPI0019214317|nr:hypothetical protein [Succinivibrio dextrinosolvens]
MTDMQHKPNGWNLPINQMTEEEWKDYFDCRKKYDIKLSDEEINKITKEACNYLKDKEKYLKLTKKLPLFPGLAISAKAWHGLKAIKNYNLSIAKEVYPDEF